MNQTDINTLLLYGNNLNSSLLKVKYYIFKIENTYFSNMFQAAVLYAEEGLHVWFITPHSIKELPADIKKPSVECLSFITFL